MTETRRRLLLSMIMLVILVAAIGVGWWLSVSRLSDPQAALEVLGSIRGRGLRAIWGDEPVTSWYIEHRSDGVPVGWRMVTRRRREDGRYVGMQVRRRGSMISEESWWLDDAARTGEYAAKESLIQLSGQRVQVIRRNPETGIKFSEGQVTVRRAAGRLMRTASGKAPDNYIPKGLTSLVMFEAAARGQKTTFSMLENSKAFVGRKLDFLAISAAPEGRRVIRADFGNVSKVMAFDEDGQLLRTSYPKFGLWSEKSSAAIVASTFREAKLYGQPTPATTPALDGDTDETTQPANAPPDDSVEF